MRKVENYRPHLIEFTAEASDVPKSLGEFESAEEAQKFISDNFVALNSKFTATRKLDDYEIDQLRNEYINELEVDLPELREHQTLADQQLDAAKSKEKNAKEAVNASLNKIQLISDEVREGTTEMNLDQAFTYELVNKGKRLYYTIMDGEIQLAGVRHIPEYEQEDLLSSSERNEQSFAKLLKASGE